MKFSPSVALTALVAFGSTTVALNIEELASPYMDLPGVKDFFAIYQKYQTAPGFNDFQSSYYEAFMKYIMLDTALAAALPTDTAVLSTFTDSPAYATLTSVVVSFASSYIASETNLPKDVKASLVSDLQALETGAAPGASAGTAYPTATTSPSPGAASAGKVFSLSAVAAGALVVVAFVL